jgi:cytochrome c biogenesis protein CcdA
LTDDLERTPPPRTLVQLRGDRSMRQEVERVQRWHRRRRRLKRGAGWLLAAMGVAVPITLAWWLR